MNFSPMVGPLWWSLWTLWIIRSMTQWVWQAWSAPGTSPATCFPSRLPQPLPAVTPWLLSPARWRLSLPGNCARYLKKQVCESDLVLCSAYLGDCWYMYIVICYVCYLCELEADLLMHVKDISSHNKSSKIIKILCKLGIFSNPLLSSYSMNILTWLI